MLKTNDIKHIKQTYRQFLHNNFNGLKLSKPLLYSWNYGLRFSLQDESKSTDDEDYFTEVIHRATTIFKTACEPTDTLFMVCKDYRHKREKIRLSYYVFSQIENLKKHKIYFTREKSAYNPHSEYNVAVTCMRAEEVNYKNIFTAIGNSDFIERHPRLDNRGALTQKEIYFLNCNKQIILQMYDDRGLDIIASNKENLLPIYKKHTDWILEYDRQQIENRLND